LLDSLLILVHVPAGVVAAIGGAAAMISAKGSAAHLSRGRIYLRALVVVCATGLGLVATRGPQFLDLGALGVLAAALGTAGVAARRRERLSVHVACMGFSYVAMLTAFYVDNGPKLPGWRLLPPASFWVLPTLVGAPLILFATLRLRDRSSPGR
jgi:uncharacterized membrane protein